jgi:hypothetical protein
MEAKPNCRTTHSTPNFQHSACIQTKKVACVRVPIQDNAKKVPGIFGLVFTVGYKDGLARGMPFLSPLPVFLRFEVDFCNSVKEG